jgi:SAM-dependent methyltransferase
MWSLRKFKNAFNYYYFLLNGRKPWTRGYDLYKRRQIIDTINQGGFNFKELRKGYGFRLDERIIEYPWLFSVLPPGNGKLLDAGAALNHEYLLILEPLRSKKVFISTLEYEGSCSCNRGVSYVYEDLRESCYQDDYFDYVVSISTIEHIGLDNTFLYCRDESKRENDPDSYLLALGELRRVLKPGKTLYLTFPYGQRKNYGWFQIFDHKMLDQMIAAFAPATVKETHFRYEPDGWKLSSREESKDATYFDIHTQKNYEPDYAAASRAIVCLELVK